METQAAKKLAALRYAEDVRPPARNAGEQERRSGAARGEAAPEGLRQVIDQPFNTIPHFHINLV